MSEPDCEVFDPEEIPRAVSAVGMELVTKGFEHPLHSHRKSQLILAVRGLVTCEVQSGFWVVPRQCAIWIPGGLTHSVRYVGDVELYILFVENEVMPHLPQNCCTFSVTPLVKELIVEVTRLPQLYDVEGADGRLIQTMIDQLAVTPIERLHLPMPVDARLRTIAATLIDNPANRQTIGEWAQGIAMSERSLFRLVMAETGMSFGRWRQQFQILFAIKRLSEGLSVQSVAYELGYESASAFITMFKKALGQPPGQYLEARLWRNQSG